MTKHAIEVNSISLEKKSSEVFQMPNTLVPAAAPGLPVDRRRELAACHTPGVAPGLSLELDPESFPDRYGMILEGSCIEPEFHDGQTLVFDKRAPIAPGDFVILIARPEIVPPGCPQAMVKRLVMGPPSGLSIPCEMSPESDVVFAVLAEQLNPPRSVTFRVDHLLALHKCVGALASSAARRRKSKTA
ncbi:S24 family peptidase [Methylosinus sp. KRF6]|uniref:S24 family peptidase n=1 Tax=Methylosinus sp. KRF6 TaxID=2846853 RepID=UPI001C0BDD6A|nr:S24 family peptidase [Methylosinus sp. KRF6]MBU3887211.1 S24 family peptidase [Methylosinus sp. KRF6]